MICASGQNGLRKRQNGLRALRKWFAQLAKWFAPHFENNGCHWENDLRVGLRLVCALVCAASPVVPVAQRKSFSSLPKSIIYTCTLSSAVAPGRVCAPIYNSHECRNRTIDSSVFSLMRIWSAVLAVIAIFSAFCFSEPCVWSRLGPIGWMNKQANC